MKSTPDCPQTIARKGGWFITFTGVQFFPLDPKVEDVCIEDIAHALANICRFGGHCREFYSVAQHSIHVSYIVPEPLALRGLMHDAAEAYVGDMVRPFKLSMPDFQAAEKRVWLAIAERFNLPPLIDKTVKHFDNVALLTERRDLIARTELEWVEDEQSFALDSRFIKPVKPTLVEHSFLYRFNELSML